MGTYVGPGARGRARAEWERTYGSRRAGSQTSDLSAFYEQLTEETPRPTFGEGDYQLPTFDAPQYDQRRVESLAQRAGSPGMSRLRSNLAAILGRSYENPNVASLVGRGALSGYGEGVESIQAGALQSGAALYQPEYAGEQAAAEREYGSAYQANLLNYRGALEDRDRTIQTGLSGFEQEQARPVFQETVRSSGPPRLPSVAQAPYVRPMAPEGLPGISDAEALASLGPTSGDPWATGGQSSNQLETQLNTLFADPSTAFAPQGTDPFSLYEAYPDQYGGLF